MIDRNHFHFDLCIEAKKFFLILLLSFRDRYGWGILMTFLTYLFYDLLGIVIPLVFLPLFHLDLSPPVPKLSSELYHIIIQYFSAFLRTYPRAYFYSFPRQKFDYRILPFYPSIFLRRRRWKGEKIWLLCKREQFFFLPSYQRSRMGQERTHFMTPIWHNWQ